MYPYHSPALEPCGPASIPLPEFLKSAFCITGAIKRRGLNKQTTGKKTMSQNRNTKNSSTRTQRFDPPEHRELRVALYSHDTMGLGHLRRNMIIAQVLAESALQATTLLISGAHEANFFSLPPSADLLTLPRFHKSESGEYVAGNLNISVRELIHLRADSIRSALNAFQPDVFIVDKVPGGAFGELIPSLRSIHERGTRCVLGVRDVLDDPETVRRETDPATLEILDSYYDEIWVYGDAKVYDPVKEYHWSGSLRDKVRFTGYLDQSLRLEENGCKPASVAHPPTEPLVVCTLGGGQDGYALARAFVEGFPTGGVKGVLLTGPFMPNDLVSSLREKASSHTNLIISHFSNEVDDLIRRADKVIAMGGYNSVCSILSFSKPAMIVPRVYPRQEQWIRAERLHRLGLVELIHPDDVTAVLLRKWIEGEVRHPGVVHHQIDMTGLPTVVRYCSQLINTHSRPRLVPTRDLA